MLGKTLMGIVLLGSLIGSAWACEVATYFSPQDDVASAIRLELDQARKTIHCSLYGISHIELAETLVDAKKSGVEVIIGLDRKQSRGKGDLHRYLSKQGIDVRIKKTYELEHQKTCVIDGKVVTTGSWNWSRSAQHQDNMALIFKNCPAVSKRTHEALERIFARDR